MHKHARRHIKVAARPYPVHGKRVAAHVGMKPRTANLLAEFMKITQQVPFEVEEVVGRPHLTITAKTIDGEKRWKLFGKAASSRYLVVVFTIRRRLFRRVTAYRMNAAERTN